MTATNEMDPLHRQVEDLKAEVIRLQQGESDRVQAQELLAESERRLSFRSDRISAGSSS
jgi:cell division protein FtsB